LYAAGKCVDEISTRVGKGFSCITRILKRAGIVAGNLRRRVEHKEIVERALKGETVSQISVAMGMSISVVFYVLQKNLNADIFDKLLGKRKKICRERIGTTKKEERAHA
jgi:hypothetical protein